MYFDSSLVIIIPGLLIALLAQAAVNSAYNKYSKVPSSRGCTGAQAARSILDENGLYDVRVEMVGGALSDHYDPRTRVLSLSQGVYGSTSLAALGIAAHEVGHAIQHYEGYAPLKLRGTLVPVANLGSTLAWPVFFMGLLFSFEPLLWAGILFFFGAVLFQLVTLPVEFNASSRALDKLEAGGYLQREEVPGARSVLRSAAMTYVAAALMSLLQLLRLLMLSSGRRRR